MELGPNLCKTRKAGFTCFRPGFHEGPHQAFDDQGTVREWRSFQCDAYLDGTKNDRCELEQGHSGLHESTRDGKMAKVSWPRDNPLVRCWGNRNGIACVRNENHSYGHVGFDEKNRRVTWWGSNTPGFIPSDFLAFPKSLEEWRSYFKNAPAGSDVGTAAIELLNVLSSRAANDEVRESIDPPKSRRQELFLYRCNRCRTVKAFEGKVPNGTLSGCHCVQYATPHSFVAVDFLTKMFFTEAK